MAGISLNAGLEFSLRSFMWLSFSSIKLVYISCIAGSFSNRQVFLNSKERVALNILFQRGKYFNFYSQVHWIVVSHTVIDTYILKPMDATTVILLSGCWLLFNFEKTLFNIQTVVNFFLVFLVLKLN